MSTKRATKPISTQTSDGWTLRGDLYEPDKKPKAIAVLGHAMMANRKTMDRPYGAGLASTLVEQGLAVLNFDVRGHGESGPTAFEGATWTYDDIVRFDVPALVKAGRLKYPNLPVVLVGHSLIGHAAMIHAGLKPKEAPDAIVSLGGNLWMPGLEPNWIRRILKYGILFTWVVFTVPFGRFDSKFFRIGSDAEPWPYVQQLVSMYFNNHLKSLNGMEDYMEILGCVRIPVLSISSEGDHLFGHPETVTRFVRLLKKARVENRIVRMKKGQPKIGHMDLVTSPHSQFLWKEAGNWILNQTSDINPELF